MEYLNKVVIRGCVGSVRTTLIGEKLLYTFSVATNALIGSTDGHSPIVETTWHQVRWFGTVKDAKWLNRGAYLEVEGRLKNESYRNSDGMDLYTTIIVAQSVEKVNASLSV